MHFYRISDSLKNTFSVAVDIQNEFYIISACIIYQFVLCSHKLCHFFGFAMVLF